MNTTNGKVLAGVIVGCIIVALFWLIQMDQWNAPAAEEQNVVQPADEAE